MVRMISGRKAGEWIPGEAVGLMPPSVYTAALLDFTAHLDQKAVEVGAAKAHETSGPVGPVARQIKAMSMFPNIYRGPQYQRTFSNIRTDDDDGENYFEDREYKDVAKATRRTRRPAKASPAKFHAKEKEPERNPELLKKKVLK
jgi:hypothetical protein